MRTVGGSKSLLFLMCSMFSEDYEIDIEALIRYAVGLDLGGGFSLDSTRSRIQTGINKLLDSCLLMHVEKWKNRVKMHDMVRDVALWIAKTSEDDKIIVNIDKPLSTLAEDDCVRDYFAVYSRYQENQISLQLVAPKLKILLLEIDCDYSMNLSHATFEGMEGLKVFSFINGTRLHVFDRPLLTLPQSTQLLTNLQTLRLNGWELGDISFIANLKSLKVLDLQDCTLNELPSEIEKLKRLKLLDLSRCRIEEEIYNGAVGKCSQLEELYLAECYYDYIRQSVVDVLTLPKLQRFVIHTPRLELSHSSFICEGNTRVLELVDFNISNLEASKTKLLQTAETLCFTKLHGRCKNIIPYIIGGMNVLYSLCLFECKEVECLIDTTSDSDDVLIPKLVELKLEWLYNLKELCRGPPLHVLHFFQKLEKLSIEWCPLLQSIFPWQCNLGNLKILKIKECNSVEVLFSMSVAQSLQHLEELSIKKCYELKHIIASEREDGTNPSKEVVSALTNSHFVMPALMKVRIGDCDNTSHQYDNHNMLPRLDILYLDGLENLVGICPKNYLAKWPTQRDLTLGHCPKLTASWIAVMDGTEQRQQHLNEKVVLSEDQRKHLPSKLQLLSLKDLSQLTLISWVGSTPRRTLSLQCLQSLKVTRCDNMKSLFSMAAHRSLPELMLLDIYECEELEQIIAENEEELEHLSNAEVFFPKLTVIEIKKCDKLKSLFSVAMVRMLPQLRILDIENATQLEEVFRHGSEDGTISEMEVVLPNLTYVNLSWLPSFVNIYQGFKLQATKHQILIVDCPKTAPSLRAIQVTPLPCKPGLLT
ncbi:disease resistance protein At4g27190-like [Gastrolobium bilobum]|uniref:disease resistance protein At4g27190-like n=1 Tax=Gastrolobium bilobum TaxID=150636 RepID=UPI002AB217FF|nr:disease resistance protein At4g27190-like [Gastrolobium bilobum]